MGISVVADFSYGIVWQFFEMNFVSILETHGPQRDPRIETRNLNKKIGSKNQNKKYEVSYWTVYNSFNLYYFLLWSDMEGTVLQVILTV